MSILELDFGNPYVLVYHYRQSTEIDRGEKAVLIPSQILKISKENLQI